MRDSFIKGVGSRKKEALSHVMSLCSNNFRESWCAQNISRCYKKARVDNVNEACLRLIILKGKLSN